MNIKTFQAPSELLQESELNISLGDLDSNQNMTGALCDAADELMSQHPETSTVDLRQNNSQQTSELISADELEALIS